MLKRLAAIMLALLMLCAVPLRALADEEGIDLKLDEDLPETAMIISLLNDSIPAKSAVLMAQQTGQILYEQNPDELLPPASITKVMTLLLVMEALEQGKIHLEDTVVASDHANSMGGSQIWLKIGEEMSVHELLKAVAISSANDASVALAEHVAGSELAFVDMMNRRAKDLGMENTLFLNCTGLDEKGHVSTARDIATMSRELTKHPRIIEYSTIWMDELRGGETQLVNTNKLVRFYPGATGLKTGTTNGAGSCLSATATREDLSLVAVVLGSPTSDERFSAARGLLDYGFANYMSLKPPSVGDKLTRVRVLHGVQETVMPAYSDPGSFVIDKQFESTLKQEITLIDDVEAPVVAGQTLGKVQVLVNGQVVGEYPLKAESAVERMTFLRGFQALLRELVKMRYGPQCACKECEPDCSCEAAQMGGCHH